MSVFNRRNAVLGWATWAAAKTVLRRKVAAKAEADAAREADEQAAARRWWRRGARGEPPPPPEPEPKKKRSKRRLVGFVMATAVGIGIWFRTRRKGGGYVEPWTPPVDPVGVPPVDAVDEPGGNSGPPAGEAESPDETPENQEPVE